MERGTGARFEGALAGFDPGRPTMVLCHNDADGLSAGALFKRCLDRAGRAAVLRVVGRGEAEAAMEVAKRVPPRMAGDFALIEIDSGCQIHPLVAQSRRMRLRDRVVLAANHGDRPAWVHVAARSARPRNPVALLRDIAPPGADDNDGGGHAQASGGALRLDDWPVFLKNIGCAAG